MEIDLQDQIKNKFDTLYNQNQNAHSGFVANIRSKAFTAFGQLGFPTIKNEEWKYTSVKPILKDEYSFTPKLLSNDIKESYLTKSFFGKGLDAYTIVLFNGQIQFELSQFPATDKAVILPIQDAFNDPKKAELIASDLNFSKNPFLALNTAVFDGGIYIEILKNQVLDKPIHLVHIAESNEHYFENTKNVIIARQGSQGQIIESVENFNPDTKVLRNASSELRVEANAKLEQYKLQKGDASIRLIEHSEVEQEGNSQYANYTFTLPGYDFVRNNLYLALTGSNIESHMYGLYLTGGKQLVDNHTLVDHQQPHCESNQMYKGIMMDQSKAVFNGKVHVHPIAQKTNAFQQNNNILFSDNASIYSKPQLEIFADDVKCSHGSTIGQLDPEALFYLKARGISEEDGRSLLVNAFAFDVTEKIENEDIKELLNKAIAETMLGVPVLV